MDVTKRYKTTATGECYGHLVLQDSLRGGFYEVRAFTRWMMNFADADVFNRVSTFFLKPLSAGNYEMEMERHYPHVPDYCKKNFWRQSDGWQLLSVTFYPEVGHWLKGLRSLVAFKATRPDGENVEVTGIVCDQSSRDMAFFSTFHHGMGVFEPTPDRVLIHRQKLFEKKRNIGLIY